MARAVGGRANPAAENAPRVSVLMPMYNQAAFVGRAIESLLAQSLTAWELIVVDDGSTDDLAAALAPYRADPRIRVDRLPCNRGLGAALNHALTLARAPLIAYLPADDLYFDGHLATLAAVLEREHDAVLAYAGVRHHYNRVAYGQIADTPLQLVQVMHRRLPPFWVERQELVTDDLERMGWAKLRPLGRFAESGSVSCEWVEHPAQRHRAIQEATGGLNVYRSRYRVREPLRFHSSTGAAIDEVEHYRRFRERPPTPPAADSLTILLVGELAYNPERMLALEERGHQLYGLWTPEPAWFNTVGPLPFGNVEDLPPDDWRAALRRLRPDVIYALLNWQAVPFVHEVFREARRIGIPFIWHFKEGPFICLEKGSWPQLADLHARADGVIYSSPELRDWFATAVPASRGRPSIVLDGDLPKREWFTDERSPLLSASDGEIHTVVPGRPIGLHPPDVAALAAQGVHLHFYGEGIQQTWGGWIEKVNRLAPGYLHLHRQVDQEDWVREFSRYDAGWLHVFRSENAGEIRRANWDDLNYPARFATLMAAGLPVLQYDNAGSIVAMQALAQQHGVGIFFRDFTELGARLRDRPAMDALRARAWDVRDRFTFDTHADRLIAFLRAVIAGGATTRPSVAQTA